MFLLRKNVNELIPIRKNNDSVIPNVEFIMSLGSKINNESRF